jgi:dipeptidyl aminopeptidase/acylaminoacyl peptidase
MPATVASYGTWSSPVTPDLMGSTGSGLPIAGFAYVEPVQGRVCWTERRPADGGRSTLIRRDREGWLEELTPAPFSVGSRVHEYGGRCYAVAGGITWFSNRADDRIYRRDAGGGIRALTPEGELRYSDPCVDEAREFLYCVMEDHRGQGEPENTLVAVPAGGGEPRVIASGYDFYSSPRLSPDGSKLAWVCWRHPNMPWDETEVWVAELAGHGLEDSHQVAGAAGESVSSPSWSPSGQLHFLSDREGFTNLYRLDQEGPRAIGPQGLDGGGGYDFCPDGRVFYVLVREGSESLVLLDPASDHMKEIPTPFTYFCEVRTAGDRALVVAAGPEHLPAVALVSPEGEVEVLRSFPGDEVGRRYISRPTTLAFPTTDGAVAHGFLYLPANPDFEAPEGELPPLVVRGHGGPIGATYPVRHFDIQFFTSRGFAVLDVNYRGSRGYGRAYRQALYGRWGEADVDDCIAGARYVSEKGLVDPARIAIRGGSASGYTVLASLAFRDFYVGGVSYFGLSDLERFTLPGGTHKFESRYNTHLIGPYPEAAELYRARSPIHRAEDITVPVLLLQGSEDRVVPPEQTRGIAAKLQQMGVPVVVEEFQGEGHGFRRAENIRRSYESELAFLASTFELGDAAMVDVQRRA